MAPPKKPWTAAVAAARANVTYVRVPQRKSPRDHQSNHPPPWVAAPDSSSDENPPSDTSEDDSAGISMKQETDDSDSDDRDAQPLAEAFWMGSGGDSATFNWRFDYVIEDSNTGDVGFLALAPVSSTAMNIVLFECYNNGVQ